MTAINIFLQKQRGLILTDALMIHFDTGTPVGFKDKCFPAPGTKMAVAARGDWRVPEAIAGQLARFYFEIDQLIEDEGTAIRDLYDDWLLHSALEIYHAAVEIMIVGWSDEDACPKAAYLVFNGQWTFGQVGPEGLAGPLPDVQEFGRLAAMGACPGRDYGLADFDPVRHGVPFMEAQRRMKHSLPTAPQIRAHIVGGHVLLTEVTEDGVSQRVIHEWPDQEGQPVEPRPFAPTGMNRQQRRRLERMAA